MTRQTPSTSAMVQSSAEDRPSSICAAPLVVDARSQDLAGLLFSATRDPYQLAARLPCELHSRPPFALDPPYASDLTFFDNGSHRKVTRSRRSLKAARARLARVKPACAGQTFLTSANCDSSLDRVDQALRPARRQTLAVSVLLSPNAATTEPSLSDHLRRTPGRPRCEGGE